MRGLTRSALLLAALVSGGSLESCATSGRTRPDDADARACRDADAEGEGEGEGEEATQPQDEAQDEATECARGPFDPHEVRERWKREQEERERDERREAFIRRH